MIANDHKIYQISIKYTKWLVPVEYIGIRFLPSSFKKMNSGLQRLRLQDLGPLLRNGVYQAQGHRGLEAAGGDPGSGRTSAPLQAGTGVMIPTFRLLVNRFCQKFSQRHSKLFFANILPNIFGYILGKTFTPVPVVKGYICLCI
jgi:hypothetical protein